MFNPQGWVTGRAQGPEPGHLGMGTQPGLHSAGSLMQGPSCYDSTRQDQAPNPLGSILPPGTAAGFQNPSVPPPFFSLMQAGLAPMPPAFVSFPGQVPVGIFPSGQVPDMGALGNQPSANARLGLGFPLPSTQNLNGFWHHMMLYQQMQTGNVSAHGSMLLLPQAGVNLVSSEGAMPLSPLPQAHQEQHQEQQQNPQVPQPRQQHAQGETSGSQPTQPADDQLPQQLPQPKLPAQPQEQREAGPTPILLQQPLPAGLQQQQQGHDLHAMGGGLSSSDAALMMVMAQRALAAGANPYAFFGGMGMSPEAIAAMAVGLAQPLPPPPLLAGGSVPAMPSMGQRIWHQMGGVGVPDASQLAAATVLSLPMPSQGRLGGGSQGPSTVLTGAPREDQAAAQGPASTHHHHHQHNPYDSDDSEDEGEDAGFKRLRRKQSNRESARRSRLRKQAELADIAAGIPDMEAETANMEGELARAQHTINYLTAANAVLHELAGFVKSRGGHASVIPQDELDPYLGRLQSIQEAAEGGVTGDTGPTTNSQEPLRSATTESQSLTAFVKDAARRPLAAAVAMRTECSSPAATGPSGSVQLPAAQKGLHRLKQDVGRSEAAGVTLAPTELEKDVARVAVDMLMGEAARRIQRLTGSGCGGEKEGQGVHVCGELGDPVGNNATGSRAAGTRGSQSRSGWGSGARDMQPEQARAHNNNDSNTPEPGSGQGGRNDGRMGHRAVRKPPQDESGRGLSGSCSSPGHGNSERRRSRSESPSPETGSVQDGDEGRQAESCGGGNNKPTQPSGMNGDGVDGSGADTGHNQYLESRCQGTVTDQVVNSGTGSGSAGEQQQPVHTHGCFAAAWDSRDMGRGNPLQQQTSSNMPRALGSSPGTAFKRVLPSDGTTQGGRDTGGNTASYAPTTFCLRLHSQGVGTPSTGEEGSVSLHAHATPRGEGMWARTMGSQSALAPPPPPSNLQVLAGLAAGKQMGDGSTEGVEIIAAANGTGEGCMAVGAGVGLGGSSSGEGGSGVGAATSAPDRGSS